MLFRSKEDDDGNKVKVDCVDARPFFAGMTQSGKMDKKSIKRGFIRGKSAKYFFYWFYPVHIMGLVILRQLLFLS